MCNHNKSHESHDKLRNSHGKSSLVTRHAGALRYTRFKTHFETGKSDSSQAL